jgi:hypothetical protein
MIAAVWPSLNGNNVGSGRINSGVFNLECDGRQGSDVGYLDRGPVESPGANGPL